MAPLWRVFLPQDLLIVLSILSSFRGVLIHNIFYNSSKFSISHNFKLFRFSRCFVQYFYSGLFRTNCPMANGIEESWPWHSFRQQTKMPSLQIPTKNLANFSRKLRLVPHIPSPFDFFQQNTEIFLPLLGFFTVENHGSVFQKSRVFFSGAFVSKPFPWWIFQKSKENGMHGTFGWLWFYTSGVVHQSRPSFILMGLMGSWGVGRIDIGATKKVRLGRIDEEMKR